MQNVIKIFKDIQNTPGLNDKMAIVEANKDNELFKKCLVFLLGDNVTGISDKKLNKRLPNMSIKAEDIFYNFSDVIDYLEKNNSGRDYDIWVIRLFLSGFNEEDKIFYSEMITKKFKMGCDAKLINKVVANLIPTFDVMLGTSIEKVKLPDKIWFSLSHKLNGSRCVYYDGKLFTRQGKEYVGLEHIIADLERIPTEKPRIYDGELIYKNPEGLTDSEAFQVGVGIANSKAESKPELKMVIFDSIYKEEFDNKISKSTYKDRKNYLLSLKDYMTDNIELVRFFYEGTDQGEIWKWLDYAEKNDIEGLMLSTDSSYECKRSKNLLKVKQFYTLDLKIIGYEEGTGRNKGRLGAFIVDFNGNPVNVGTGYDDALRDLYWYIKGELLGRVIEVKYKEISKDKKTGLESLQFPVFVSLREPGKEVSYD